MPVPQGDITTSEMMNTPAQEVKEEPKQEEEKQENDLS